MSRIYTLLLLVTICYGCKRQIDCNPPTPEALENESTADRFYRLTDQVLTEYECGRIEDAKRSIVDLRGLIHSFPDDWNYGNAIHKANLVDGRIALAEGRIEDAKRFLLSSATIKGSPQLNSFGPNMMLADELLRAGERDVVIKYLDLCGGFWKKDRGRVEKWKGVIKGGGFPDFGANLEY